MAALVAATLGLSCAANPRAVTSKAVADASGFGSNWTTYHANTEDTGVDAAGTTLLPSRAAWTSPTLDGQLFGEPLVADGMVVAATENDTVYVMAADTGRILWSRHLATPVPSEDLPCGDISPEVGITGTPVIDLARHEIFVDADELVNGPPASGGVEASHVLFGLDLFTGEIELDEGAMPNAGEDQLAQLQRPGLTLDDGSVVIAYGQNAGDCPGPNGPAHGYVVSISETGGPLHYFQIGSGQDRGAVWMGGSSPVVDPEGNVYVASADGYDLGAGQPYDDSDAVLELSPTMQLESLFYPSDWQQLSAQDKDLGTGNPVLVDGFVFQVGKSDIAYLLHQGQLGGEEGEFASMPLSLCSGDPDGGRAVDGSVVYVPCPNGVTAVKVSTTPPYMTQLWTDDDGAAGGPIIAGGLIWTIGSDNAVHGLNPANGHEVTTISFGGHANHFPTPTVGDGLLLLPATNQVVAYMGPAGLPPPPPPPPPPPFFTVRPGFGTDIAVGANGSVWVVGTNPVPGGYGIYQWNAKTWTPLAGGAVTIAVDPAGNPWITNSAHHIFHHSSAGWTAYPGSATDIAVGANGSVWVVGTNPVPGGYGIYQWNANTWTPLAGGAVTIAVDPAGNPWITNSAHHIFHHSSAGWTAYPGSATDIAVGANGSVWVVGTNPVPGGYGIYQWNANTWTPLAGGAVTIAVDPAGNPWITNSAHSIFAH